MSPYMSFFYSWYTINKYWYVQKRHYFSAPPTFHTVYKVNAFKIINKFEVTVDLLQKNDKLSTFYLCFYTCFSSRTFEQTPARVRNVLFIQTCAPWYFNNVWLLLQRLPRGFVLTFRKPLLSPRDTFHSVPASSFDAVF